MLSNVMINHNKPNAVLKVQEGVTKGDVKTRNVHNFSSSIYAIGVLFFYKTFQKYLPPPIFLAKLSEKKYMGFRTLKVFPRLIKFELHNILESNLL